MVSLVLLCYAGVEIGVRTWLPWRKLALWSLLLANLLLMLRVSVFASYPLQDWIQPINDTYEMAHPKAYSGKIHPIDVNNDFDNRMLRGLLPAAPSSRTTDSGR